MDWKFYGRQRELTDLVSALRRGRFFFVRVTGRRRIGKTTLVRHALEQSGHGKVLYVQIPDSAPAGVISAVRDAIETFAITQIDPPTSLLELARTLDTLIRAGYIVALDEFQYFSRKALHEFLSHLQATIDELTRDAASISGGLIVLGSLHTELTALLDDRDTPLYNRTTDAFELPHLDIASILQILATHADRSPERLLFCDPKTGEMSDRRAACVYEGMMIPRYAGAAVLARSPGFQLTSNIMGGLMSGDRDIGLNTSKTLWHLSESSGGALGQREDT